MSETFFLLGVFMLCVLIYECVKILIRMVFWCAVTFMCWYLGKASVATESIIDIKFDEVESIVRGDRK